jgi:AcrR family transcriptional regulator
MKKPDKDLLYRTALIHFASSSVDSALIEDIAKDAGMPIATLVNLHASGEALFLAAVHHSLRDLSAELLTIAESDASADERLLMMTRCLATPTKEVGTALFVVFREILEGNARAATSFETTLGEGFEAFVRVIGEGQFRGEIKPLPPRFIMSVLLSGVVVPQLLGLSGLEDPLRGVHAQEAAAGEAGPSARPRSALLAASIEAVFNGIANTPK